MSNPHRTILSNADYLSTAQVALMFNVSTSVVVKNLVDKIPHHRLSPRLIRFHKSDVQAFIETSKVSPVETPKVSITPEKKVA